MKSSERVNQILDICFYPGVKGESPVTTRARAVVEKSQQKRAGLRRLSQDLRSGAVYQHAPTR